MAHGVGQPWPMLKRQLASHRLLLPSMGRAKDWVPAHHPGRFEVLVDGTSVGKEFGANGEDWSWEHVGAIDLQAGEVVLTLRDLTGFNGRCDALYFGPEGATPPNKVNDESRQWRRRLRGLSETPLDAGEWDGRGWCRDSWLCRCPGCGPSWSDSRCCTRPPGPRQNASTEIGQIAWFSGRFAQRNFQRAQW